jgi:F-type H+-transporting ATPase subunit delta
LIERAVARRYARGLFEVAQEQNQVDEVAKDLQQVVAAIRQVPELRELLEHQLVLTRNKKEIIASLWRESVCQLVYSFLHLVIDKHRERYLESIVDEYLVLYRELKNIAVAEVKSAFPLDSRQEDALLQILEKITSKTVEMQVNVAPELVGGIIIKIGDRVYDGSVKRQLQVLREHIVERSIGKFEVGT